jgi:DNA-binding NarL/FixJ family response regulator
VAARPRVVALEDHPLFLDALCRRLGRIGFDVSDALTDPVQLLDTVRRAEPDLVLIDLGLPDGADGATLTARLRVELPGVVVVVLSAYDDADSIGRCLDAGADGFISKRVDAAELADCLHAALRGEAAFDRRSARTAIGALRQPEAAPTLSPREIEVLQLVADGASTADIATRLHLSPFTVKTHVSRILDRLEVPDRAAAVAVALRQRLIT